MREIYLVRHGMPKFEDKDETPIYLGGWTDINLRDDAKSAAAKLAEYFKDKRIDNYYTSPLKRTKQTLEAFIPEGKQPIELEDAREIIYGEWEGKPKAEYFPKYKKAYMTANAPEELFPKGHETQDHAARRLLDGIKKTEGNCVIVSHGGIMCLLVCLVEGIPYYRFLEGRNPYLGITKIIEDDNGNYHVEFKEKEVVETEPDHTFLYMKEDEE